MLMGIQKMIPIPRPKADIAKRKQTQREYMYLDIQLSLVNLSVCRVFESSSLLFILRPLSSRLMNGDAVILRVPTSSSSSLFRQKRVCSLRFESVDSSRERTGWFRLDKDKKLDGCSGYRREERYSMCRARPSYLQHLH